MSRGDTFIHVCTIHCCPYFIQHLQSLCSFCNTIYNQFESRHTLIHREYTAVQYSSCISKHLQLGSEQAQEATLSIQTRLAFNIEGREWHSKKHKQPRNPIISFLSWLLLCIYQPLILKMMIQEERESQGNPQFLFFQSSLYSSVSWKQRVSVKCVHIKKHFHCSGKKYTHTHKLQNISVSISESQICI